MAATVQGAGAQTRIFASIDLAVGLLTLATQIFATGRLLKRFGTGAGRGALPAVYVVGFAALALVPSLAVVMIVQVVQRWMNFAIANPARQVFFTVLGARGEIQGEEPDRRRDLSRLRRAVWLGVRQPAGVGTEARRHRAGLRCRWRRDGWSCRRRWAAVAGTPRRAHAQRRRRRED